VIIVDVCAFIIGVLYLMLQPYCLELSRSDYMIDHAQPVGDVFKKSVPSADSLSLRQVEFNTISASFSGLSERISHLHRYVFLFKVPVAMSFISCHSDIILLLVCVLVGMSSKRGSLLLMR
jgi:hypothetical protein